MQIVPRDQIVHVEYDELVRDPAAMAHIDLRAPRLLDAMPRSKARMQQWLVEHPSDKHGKHNYALEDFGLTPEIIRDAPRRAAGAAHVAGELTCVANAVRHPRPCAAA